MRRLLSLCLLLLGCTGAAFSQRIALKHYSQSEGLRNQVIMCLLQDQTGFIWVGTENGLFRYDGRAFVRFDSSDGLRNDFILSLHMDAHGNLWIGTQGGITRYHDGRFVPEGPAYSAGWYDIGDIASDASGRVYFGSPGGLGVLEPLPNGSFRFHTVVLPDQVSAAVHAVLVDQENAVWFSSGAHLFRLAQQKVEEVGPRLQLPKEHWDAIALDAQGSMWLRGGKLLLRKPSGEANFQLIEDGLTGTGDVQHLSTTASGDVFVSSGLGLLKFNSLASQAERRAYFDPVQGLPDASISCVLQDREGSIWLGSWGGGLYRWLGFGNWKSWTRQEGLSDNVIWQITRDAQGTLWAGTGNGLNALDADGKRWHQVVPAGMSRSIDVRTLVTDEGNLWIGLNRDGVWWWDKHHRARPIPFALSSPNVNVLKLVKDEEGTVWAATDAGLYRTTKEGGDLKFVHPQVSFAGFRDSIYDVFCDRNGRIWAAGSKGLFCFDHGTWKVFRTKDGLAANDVRCVTEDQNGRIWISYDSAHGLTRLTPQGKLWIPDHFTQKSGLRSDNTNFLGCDKRGRIWSGTDNGLDVYNNSTWTHYGTEEGVWWPDSDTNGFWADEDGTVWIGSSGGISCLRPGPYAHHSVPPGVAVTAITSGSKQLSTFQAINLPFRGAPLEIAFSGLSFVNGTESHFRYRLHGLDDKWVETSHGSIAYSHLSPGAYDFEVYARNGDGLWSTAPAKVHFEVLTPWWMTLWCRLLIFATLTWLAVRIYRWRVRSISLQNKRLRASLDERTTLLEKANTANRLKNEFLANMSHEIRTPIHGLMAMIELTLATELTEEQRENLLIINDSATSLNAVLSDVLDLSKIEANCMELEYTEFSLPLALEACLSSLQLNAKEKCLDLKSHIPPNTPQTVIGDPVRLRQILTNLIGNAVKFTHRGGVCVSVKVIGESVSTTKIQFEVQDSGIGVPPEAREKIFEAFTQGDGSMTRRFGGTGLGLSICSKLVHLMGGDIWLESQPAKGSTFYFTAVFRKPEHLARGLSEEATVLLDSVAHQL